MQGVKPGEAEVGFSDVLDVQPPLGVPGVLTDEGLPGALSDELGVHGDVVLGKLGAFDALGGPENCLSDSASLLTGLNIPHAVMSARMRCCRSGLRKKCIFNVDSLLFLCLKGRLFFFRT